MLTNGKEIIKAAREGGYGIGAFNISDAYGVEIVLTASEELCTPVILQIGDLTNPSPENRRMSPSEAKYFIRYLRDRAEASSVPVIIHLDHCPTFDGCVRAINNGATSIMIDASMKPFAENVAMTKKVVEIGAACDVTVESEIGHVTGHANSTGNVYTTVEEAKAFYEATGVDMLAVSIGTVHGVYTSEPVLQYDLIKDLRDAIPCPLVMHGSSGLTGEQFQNAVKNGIVKINFATYLQLNVGEAIRAAALAAKPNDARMGALLGAGKKRGVEYVKEHIGYFGTKSICCC